jgi:hypothetical protein
MYCGENVQSQVGLKFKMPSFIQYVAMLSNGKCMKPCSGRSGLGEATKTSWKNLELRRQDLFLLHFLGDIYTVHMELSLRH